MKRIELFRTFPNMEKITAEKLIAFLKSQEVKGGNAFTVYQKRTSSRRVAIQAGEYTFYTSSPMGKGNKKIDKTCLCSKLLPFNTCPNCKGCCKKCYAVNGCLIYKGYTIKMALYTYLAWNDPEKYADLIIDQLSRAKGVKYVRLHESGDFFSPAYCAAIARVIKLFPRIQFYTYTKSDFTIKLGNVNIIPSIVEYRGKKVVNFGTLEEIQAMAKELKCHICPCGISGKKVVCMKDCTLCAVSPLMLFLLH